MDLVDKIFSETIAFRTYSSFLKHLGRRESLSETINRNMQMHLDRFPKLSKDILKAYQRVHDLQVMPSMRAMQFSGNPILKNEARQYNCSYAPVDDIRVFGEFLFLLLSGVGVGFSVQKRHISKLPKIQVPKENGFFVVQDSIMGWAQALDLLIDAYFLGRVKPNFDFGSIRSRGSYLVTTGSKAPGPEPLKKMLELVEAKLNIAIGRQLTDLELHDIICIVSDAVLAGGIRRAALISLFDRDSKAMLTCKHGDWWTNAPYRARANNSAILPRNKVTQEEFYHIFEMCQASGSGEPGFYWTNDEDWGTNPCTTGETEILTENGYRRIDELVDKTTEVWNGFEWSTVTPKITGYNQELVTVSFSDGRTLTCTKYHNFHISKNYNGEFEIIKAKDLVAGMKLIKHKFPIIDFNKTLDNAYTQGFIAAEGMELNKTLYVYTPKEMCIKRLQGVKSCKLEKSSSRFLLKLNDTPMSKSFVPLEYSIASKLEWLSGLFDGDGCELKEGGLQLVSINLIFLNNVQKLLSLLGIQSKVVASQPAGYRELPNQKGGKSNYFCQESKRICIGSTQIQELKTLGLRCERLKFDKNPQRDASQFVIVTDITESGVADTVYCFTEPKRNLGIFNGVITGQCVEISLKPNQFCNLTTINQTGITSEKDFMNRVYAASLIGTLQASYTDFSYLRPVWKKTTEDDALIGVSFTGIADSGNFITPELLQKGSQLVLDVNEKYARKIGINSAARTTAIKPEGTSSCILGSSSGIHARHADYYIRRIRMNKDDAIGVYLNNVMPELVEADKFSSTGIVVSFPQKSPEGAITRHQETALTLFNRALNYHKNWIEPGHRDGVNKHNVSVTISVKDNEWDELKEKMWKSRNNYSGISLLPFDNSSYVQMPFEDCTKEQYQEMVKLVKEVDLKLIKEEQDNTTKAESIACGGNSCEIT